MKYLTQKIGNNVLKQGNPGGLSDFLAVDDVIKSWDNVVTIKQSGENTVGLRPAQFGALCAIKSHWTVSNNPATVVMPTGTGKTETMIATVVSEMVKRTLVIVPSHLLRQQTVSKFLSFGVLQKIGIINDKAQYPSVTLLKSAPKTKEDLEYFVSHSNS